jgi:hypothetical protein
MELALENTRERYERLEIGFVAHLGIGETVAFVAAAGWRKDARAIAEVVDDKDVDPARRERVASDQQSYATSRPPATGAPVPAARSVLRNFGPSCRRALPRTGG